MSAFCLRSQFRSLSKCGKLYLSPTAKFAWLRCLRFIFNFEKLNPMTSFWRGTRSVHVLWFASSRGLPFFPAPSNWMETYLHHPEWCYKSWGVTRRSYCWAQRCKWRTCCCSGCQSVLRHGARTRWRTKLHFHTSELPYPLQRWFLVW